MKPGPRSAPRFAIRALDLAAYAVAWTAYLPLGTKYAAAFAAALAAPWLLRDTALRSLPGVRQVFALLAVLAVTALWTPAPWNEVTWHLLLYGMLLLAPWLGAAFAAETARRALRHFVAASLAVAALFALRGAGALPDAAWWLSSTVDASGNQRIANSILLAVGAATAAWFALQAAGTAARGAWAAAAAAIAIGLVLQDRRSGMLLLPIIFVAWALVGQPTAARRVTVAAAVAMVTAAVWWSAPGARSRFEEGLAELRAGVAAEQVATSWGQRLAMLEITADMVRERPLAGHGVASWKTLWARRTRPGTALAAQTAPHSEYLHVAQQAGVIGLAAFVWVMAAMLRASARLGPAGVPALVCWTAIACAGLFNSVLRDAKFSLPLLLLAALALAQARPAAAQPRS